MTRPLGDFFTIQRDANTFGIGCLKKFIEFVKKNIELFLEMPGNTELSDRLLPFTNQP